MKNKPDGIKFVHQEALRECSVKSSPELRKFLFRVLQFMDLETKKEVLRDILFCEDVQHARRAGKILGDIREAWAAELLDIALQDDRPEVRYAALCGSSGRNPSWLVPRLQKAVADPESSIRNYAYKMLQSFPGAANSYGVTERCHLCGSRFDPAAMDRHLSRHSGKHNGKQAESSGIGAQAVDGIPEKPKPVLRWDKPDYYEWNMTTFNMPKYRRR